MGAPNLRDQAADGRHEVGRRQEVDVADVHAVGEELLLLNHAHQTIATSPYRAAGPIFVSRSGRPGTYQGELAPMLRDRLLSLRAYDENAFIVDAEVAEGAEALRVIERFLAAPQVAHVDAHFARRGCFAARIERA